MIKLTQEQFDAQKQNYSRISSPKKGWYEVVCTCARCGGRGYISFSSVDNSKCWQCNTTGKSIEKIQIVKNNPILTPKQVEERRKSIQEKNKKYFLDLGFKPVDFKIETWCGEWFNFDDYYRIVKETEKAYLMARVCDITASTSPYEFWVPKKAITFNK